MTNKIVVNRLISWDDEFPLKLVQRAPSEGGFFVVAGPQNYPMRPYLELEANQHGWTGRKFLGDGTPANQLIVSETLPALNMPSEVESAWLTGADSWVILADSHLAFFRAGQQEKQQKTAAHYLFPCQERFWGFEVGADVAFVIAEDAAWEARHPFNNGRGAVADASGNLYTIQKVDGENTLVSLSPSGESGSLSSPGLGLFDKLLCVSPDLQIINSAGTIRVLRGGKEAQTYGLTFAGLSADGQPYWGGQEAGALVLHENSGILSIPMSDSLLKSTNWSVAAVEADKILVRTDTEAAWLKRDGSLIRKFDLTDASYLEEVFPHLWELKHVCANPAGTVFLSTSGPDGVAVLSISLL